MTAEQARVLDRRFREAAQRQPDLKVLRGLLLGLGGTHLVAPPSPDADLALLVDAGFVMDGPVVRTSMKRGECHRNIAKIWAAKHHEVVGIGTGYALSDDGLWRQHSWGLRREGILETTMQRVKYFGVLLQHGNADSFAVANLAGGCRSCGVKGKTRKIWTGATRSPSDPRRHGVSTAMIENARGILDAASAFRRRKAGSPGQLLTADAYNSFAVPPKVGDVLGDLIAGTEGTRNVYSVHLSSGFVRRTRRAPHPHSFQAARRKGLARIRQS